MQPLPVRTLRRDGAGVKQETVWPGLADQCQPVIPGQCQRLVCHALLADQNADTRSDGLRRQVRRDPPADKQRVAPQVDPVEQRPAQRLVCGAVPPDILGLEQDATAYIFARGMPRLSAARRTALSGR